MRLSREKTGQTVELTAPFYLLIKTKNYVK